MNKYYLTCINRFNGLRETMIVAAKSLPEAELVLNPTHEILWMERMEKANGSQD